MNHSIPCPPIAILTDFGTVDPYVGIMKGVIASRCPAAQVIDLTHAVQPQNVRHGAYLLHSAFRHCPPNTIFLAVVDPGVGTARRAIAVAADHGVYIGPDNGLFSFILDEVTCRQAVAITPVTPPASSTFHGRDVFAPAAAAVACGARLEDLGPALSPDSLIRLPSPRMDLSDLTRYEGEVLHIDRFGNIITSLGQFAWQGEDLVLSGRVGVRGGRFAASGAHVIFKGQPIESIQMTYGHTRPGALLALISSDGWLEIAVNQGNAASLLDARIGDPVVLSL